MNNNTTQHKVRFRLAISAEDYLHYYQGNVNSVIAYTETNQRIQFPANTIRKFVTANGIFGLFEMSFDANKKFLAIDQLS